jgi:hypothetical protein
MHKLKQFMTSKPALHKILKGILCTEEEERYTHLRETKSHYKNSKKRAGGVIQVVEHLPSKHEVLSSNPNTTKKRWTSSHSLSKK